MSSTITSFRPPSGPSAGMLRRRHAIVEAAHEIISKEGEGGLTMRRLAAKAKVSPTTPYNLFGSKEAVLRAVFDADFVNFDRYFMAKASTDPLTRLFDLVDFSFDAFSERPVFYKALFRTLHGARESEVRSSEWLRSAFIESMVAEAVESGRIDAAHDRLIAATWARMVRSAILEWVAGEIKLKDARRETGLSIALFLEASVPARFKPELRRLRSRYEKAS
jgi:AcrR family transcriptional regulator